MLKLCIYKTLHLLYIQFDPEEVVDEEHQQIIIVWEFDVDPILSANINTRVVAPVIPEVDNNLMAPLLDINEVCCNCSKFPAADKVLLPPLENSSVEGDTEQ